ncbi:hypothetical protein MMC10_002665 [Thelotrema lepadinum]|nr:hypothetical protein [Thelotrema lepadinum]
MDLPAPTYVPADTSGARAIVILAWLFPALATVAVALRVVSRRIQRLKFGVDDILIAVALIPLWGHTAIILVTVYLGGVGHPLDTLQPGNSIALFKGLTSLQYSFGTTLGLIKASIIFLLIRIFHTRQFKILARIVLGYIICWALMCIFIGSFLCVPFAKNWDQSVPGTCGSLFKAHTCIAALDILGNCLIIALPLPWIWKLHQNRATKLFLSGIFALGFLDVAVGILRVVYLIQLLTVTDIQGNAVNTWVWSVAEPSIAVFVACGPTYKPLLRRFLRSKSTKSSYLRQTDQSGRPGQKSANNDSGTYKLGAVGPKSYNKTTIHAIPRANSSIESDDHPILDHSSPPAQTDNTEDTRFNGSNSPHGGINLQREVRIDYSGA